MREYNYHYTNLDTLVLILKNRTFRLSPLSNMDDKQESMTQEKINLGKYIYVSCWTKTETESIPMWSMYTSRNSGVRIKLRSSCFREYDIDKECMQELCPNLTIEGPESSIKTFFPIEDFVEQPFICTPFQNKQLLIPVTYTSDSSLLQPKLIKESQTGLEIEFDKLGKFKNKAWQFQDEWRYRMTVIPLSVKESLNTPPEQLSTNVIQRIISETYAMPEFIDLDIEDKVFNEMEVTISPFMSDGNRIIAYDLMEKYCTSAAIKVSELDNLV